MAALARDRERIRAFAASRESAGNDHAESEVIGYVVDSGDMQGARDEFAGAFDLMWRTPEALAREFAFRAGQPGTLELAVSAAQAEMVRRDADDAVRLVGSLETADAAESVAKALWSDRATAVFDPPPAMAREACDAARLWGAGACDAIRDQSAASAYLWMQHDARASLAERARRAVDGMKSLRALIGDAQVPSAPDRQGADSRPGRRARAMLAAQCACVVMSSLCEARSAAIAEISAVNGGVSPARVQELLDSYSGFYDTPKSIVENMSSGQREVLADRTRQFVLDPSGVSTLAARVRDAHAASIEGIRKRILDECGEAVSSARDHRGSTEGQPLAPDFRDQDSMLAGDLIDGVAVTADAAVGAALFLELIPSAGITQAAGIVVLLGDCAWQLTQVTPGLQRRAEVACYLHNGVVRTWLGSRDSGDDAALADGTIVDRRHAAQAGILGAAERSAFEHYRRAILGKLGI